MSLASRPALGFWVVILVGFAPACRGCDLPLFGQSHVFDSPVPTACRTVTVPKKIDINRAADILFVIDNSGSMTEEQDNLAANASAYATGGPCDLSINPNAVSELRAYITTGPARGVPAEGWVAAGLPMAAEMKARYDDCGFIERLQLFDNDFQIGIITTDRRDMEGFDRGGGNYSCISGPTAPNFPNNRAATPQRGCLQPVPGSASKIIRPTDGNTAQISQRFRDAVRNVGACSSGIEEGLQNIKEFLTPDAGRAQPSCYSDFQQFLRGPDCQRGPDGGPCLTDNNGQPIPGPERKLVVIVLSDEEDCSTSNEQGGPITDSPFGTGPSLCYSAQQFLKPTSEFVEFLRTRKNDSSLVAMAAIIGGTKDSNGRFTSGNCRCNGDSADAPPITECAEVNGNSIFPPRCGQSQANAFCGSLPNGQVDGGMLAVPCCTADRGSRYANVASLMPNFILDSICAQNYKSTLIDIADLINQNDVVPLGEAPQDPRQLVVEVKKGEGADFVSILPFTGNRNDPAYLACNGCTTGNCNSGFALTNNCTQVKFLGTDVPPQGAEIRVSYLGPPVAGAPRCQ